MCFAVNFAKFLRTPFLTEHLRWLLLFWLGMTSSLRNRKFLFCQGSGITLLSLNELDEKSRTTIILGNFVNKA